MGAAVLVVLAVAGFPLVFDTQPRPISADIRVEIPKRDQTPPLGTSANAPVPAASALDAREEVVDNNAKTQAKGDIKPVEFPIHFFLDMAWAPTAMTADALRAYPTKWAASTFGGAHAAEIGELQAPDGASARLQLR